jgi:thymidylate synthase
VEVTVRTVAQGWQTVVDLYRDQSSVRTVSRHGVSFEIPGLTIQVTEPTNQALPAGYPYPELVGDYRDRLFGDQRERSLLYRRLRCWETGDGVALDQLAGVVELLRSDRASRAAGFSVWRPEADLAGDYPVSPVGGACRVVGDTLYLFITARSVDVWVGLVPELLAMNQLAMELGLQVGCQDCRVVYHAWSAHLYEVDYLTYVAGGA